MVWVNVVYHSQLRFPGYIALPLITGCSEAAPFWENELPQGDAAGTTSIAGLRTDDIV